MPGSPTAGAQDDTDSDGSLLDLYMVKEALKHAARTTDHSCLVCKLEAKSAAQLYDHMHHFHVGSDPYHCACGSAFLTVWDLHVHEHNVHQDCRYACKHCAVTAPTRTKILKHVHVHSDWKFLCEYCGTLLSSKDALREHMKRHDDQKVYPCVQCGKEFSSSLSIQIHF